MLTIILNEWKILIRNRGVVYITIIFVLSLVSIIWMGIVQNNNQKQIQISAQKHVRSQWDNLKLLLFCNM
jgi:ABC-type transport system involved in cytochrome c biogenesis permease component